MLKGGLRSDIEMQIDVADDIWPVTIDPLQFELALLNLTINARHAMPDGRTLKVWIRNLSLNEPAGELAAGDYVQVLVIDTGTGMDEEVIAKALDPFFTTKSVGQGSGMGLPQAYGFAKQAGGTLTIESKPGNGVTATLYLPRAHTFVTANTQDKKTRQSPVSLKGRVLLVDDDSLVLDVVRPALEATGLTVRVAQSGGDALALLNAGETFDIVFSDIVMPGQINGIELANIIQKQFPKMRVMLATGYSERRVDIPGVRILAKPYGVNEAVNALSRELAPSP